MVALQLSLLALLFIIHDAVAAFGAQQGRVFVSTPVSDHPKKLVNDCMSPATHVLTPDMSVDETMVMLLCNELSGAPVVDSENKVIGIVSSFDFLQQEAFEGALLPMEGSAANVEKYVNAAKKICGRKIADVMSPNVATVFASAPMRHAAALMTEKRLHRLPVLDDKTQKLIGVLTSANVMQDLLNTARHLPAANDDDDIDATLAP